ncbi:MAG: proline--tRNA ligase [Bacteriovoracales bacterium]|nr:proline--tRNA ligase [Bacteriovoracales bacterium]
MKLSSGFWQTYKESPQDAEIISHKLMVRAGLIMKSSSGLYHYLPMGLRSIKKVEQIVREEHNKEGFFELTMTMVTPGELWKETKRWDKMGDLILKFKDKGGKDLCLSPTNEESVVDIFRRTVKSYKQLPIGVYQINTKYRDEIRPRYGLMRCREFIMKDAYSFVLGEKAQDDIYQRFYDVYNRIFSRMKLHFIPVEADAGNIGSTQSKNHEFQVLADSGEDEIAFCETGTYAANLEKAETKRGDIPFHQTDAKLEKVSTPGISSIRDLCHFLDAPPYHTLKAMIYTAVIGKKEKHVAAFLLGDDTLNEIKLKNHLDADHIFPSTHQTIQELGIPTGSIGPMGMPDGMPVIFDAAIDLKASYIVGATEKDHHYKNYIPERDSRDPSHRFECVDLRKAKAGDISKETGEKIVVKRGIEVGHIFQLGDHYSKAMNAMVQVRDGHWEAPLMGCYGIGIGRTVAACIEQNHDDEGIIWPGAIAPYHIYFGIISKNEELRSLGAKLYQKLWEAGLETVLDDRGLGPGFMFKESDLLGLPLRVILGEKTFKRDGTLEIKIRRTGQILNVAPDQLVEKIKELLEHL